MNHLEPKKILDVKAQLGHWLRKRIGPNLAGFANVMIAYKRHIRKEPWAIPPIFTSPIQLST
ncbi:MAG: hypothetical protein P8I83_12585 [Paracoccaceae bacterium]|nr:hypothetical protein [Paracoccaceae bacterium]